MKNLTKDKIIQIIMVNPSDGANASRNETHEILTVNLMNRSVYIGCIRVKMIYSQIKEKMRGKLDRSMTCTIIGRKQSCLMTVSRKGVYFSSNAQPFERYQKVF